MGERKIVINKWLKIFNLKATDSADSEIADVKLNWNLDNTSKALENKDKQLVQKKKKYISMKKCLNLNGESALDKQDCIFKIDVLHLCKIQEKLV